MSDVVIKAENLGKHDTSGHQAADGRDVALRDVLCKQRAQPVALATDLVRGRPLILGNELEEVWALKVVSSEIRRGKTVSTGFHPELTGRENVYLREQ